MKNMASALRNALSVLLILFGISQAFAASELPLLTSDTSDPILYRIKNTRRTSKNTANYWTTTGLSTNQADATQVYFTGSKNGSVLCVKIHSKDGQGTLLADFTWGDGTDWYIKQFSSTQGGTDVTTGSVYKGVLISNASTFPNVNGDQPAADGLGCWYVGSSNTAAWLYGGQWDGSIFTMEIVDPSRLPQEEETAGSYIVNPSFETGDLTGWVYGSIGGDHGVKDNSDGTYTVNGMAGDYIYNTWYSSDSYVAETQNQCVYQTITGLPVGEYRLTAKLASNNYASAKTPVTLFANNFTYDDLPLHKGSVTDFELEGIFVTGDVRSLTVGVRSAAWFKVDDFQLVSLGETEAYKAYVANAYADASIAHPVMFDAFDGQKTEAFTYKEIGGHTHGGYPLSSGGIQNDRTMTDRSKMQVWTADSYQLGNSTTSVSYTDLPNGYYRISSEVRVYDGNGDYNGTAQGLSLYANNESSAITSGTGIAHGNKSGKGFWGNYSVICQVTDGRLEAGFRINDASFSWLGWQNFCIEYIGKGDPGKDLLALNLPAGQYVPLCLPYDLKPEYFGQTYTIAQVQDGVATLLPAQDVPAGMPCVVLATGENNVKASDVVFNFSTPSVQATLWNNTLLKGDYDSHSWTATLVDGKEVDASALTYTVADLYDLRFTATIENNAANRFWAQNPNYSTSSSTVVERYLAEPTYGRRDQPNPILVPVVASDAAQTLTYSRNENMENSRSITLPAGASVVEIYNLMPGLTYYYKTSDGKSAGQFTVGGTLRMIQVGKNVYNARDLGGKKTSSGQYVKYGRIFRSGEFNGGYTATLEELQIMRDMGVGAEIDLRNEEPGTGTSAFGFSVEDDTYYAVAGKNYIADGPNTIDNAEAHKHWKNEFGIVLRNLRQQRGIDFHCRIGADRTGMLAVLLEGVLGVTEADLLRDYETTTFSTAAGTRLKNVNGFDNLLNNTFKNNIPTGGTLRDAFDKFFINKLGIRKAEIEEFRSLMLADDPTADAELISMQASLEVLRAAIKEGDKYQIGEGLGQYTSSDASVIEAYRNAVAEGEAYLASQEYNLTTTNLHADAIGAALAALAPTLTLNMPKAGQFMTIQSYAHKAYVSCDGTQFPMVSEPDRTCVFYYDGKQFINYATGMAFSKRPLNYGQGVDARITPVYQTEGAAITVKPSCYSTQCAYSLHTKDGSSDVMFLTKDAGNNLDGFYTWFAHEDEDVLLHEVSNLDISLNKYSLSDMNDGSLFYGSFYAPVPVEIDGAKAYTVYTLEDGSYMGKALEGPVPANTPVILSSEKESVMATLLSETPVLDETTKAALASNVLKGMVASKKGSYSSVGASEGVLGFYATKGTSAAIPGFTAYMGVTKTGTLNLTGVVPDAILSLQGNQGNGALHYDLNGRQTDASRNGLHIHNGKKVLIK